MPWAHGEIALKTLPFSYLALMQFGYQRVKDDLSIIYALTLNLTVHFFAYLPSMGVGKRDNSFPSLSPYYLPHRNSLHTRALASARYPTKKSPAKLATFLVSDLCGRSLPTTCCIDEIAKATRDASYASSRQLKQSDPFPAARASRAPERMSKWHRSPRPKDSWFHRPAVYLPAEPRT